METNQKQILIDLATRGDAIAIANILKKTWMQTYINEDLKIDKTTLSTYLKKVTANSIGRSIEEKDDHTHFLLARFNKTVAGVCKYVDEPGHVRLKMLYVLPKYQNIGVGSALMRELLQRNRHRSEIVLNVAQYNRQAILFYRKFGFRNSKRKVQTSLERLPNGVIIPEIMMVRKKNTMV